MPVRPGAATAALWLSAVVLLFTASGLPGEPARFVCEEPGEASAERGLTTAVVCHDGPQAARPLRGPVRLLFGLTLDINRAVAASLEVLPRIGPQRAAAIVRAREQAAFTSVAELARVRGIGPKTIEGLEGWVSVGRETGEAR